MKTGRVVQGTVYDCNKKTLERLLKNYDNQLYLKWNPDKNGGVGLWEIRRRPDHKRAVPRWEIDGRIVFDLQYVEADIVHHVLDLPALTYQALDTIKAMDTFAVHNWVDDLEYRETKSRDKAFEDNRNEMRYAARQYRKAFEDMREEIRSGRSPADFLQGDW